MVTFLFILFVLSLPCLIKKKNCIFIKKNILNKSHRGDKEYPNLQNKKYNYMIKTQHI